MLRLRIPIVDGVNIVTRRVDDLQRCHQVFDQRVSLRLRLNGEIEVGHPDQLFHVGPGNQGAAEHHDLLIEIGLRDKTCHQRPEDRLGIDIHARRGFVLVGYGQDSHHTGDSNDPGNNNPQPTTHPHAPQDAHRLSNQFIHRTQTLSVILVAGRVWCAPHPVMPQAGEIRHDRTSTRSIRTSSVE